MNLLIVFNDGKEKHITNVGRCEHDYNHSMFMIEKGGSRSFVPDRNVRYFGTKETWMEDK